MFKFQPARSVLNKVKAAALDNQQGVAPVLLVAGILGVVVFLAIATSAPFKNTLFSDLFPKEQSQAASLNSNCWPTSGANFAGTLAGQPNAIWCYSDLSDGPSTAIKGNNTWVDDFNHGLTLGKFDTVNYTDFPMVGTGYKSQLFRHGNHWMRDVSGVDQDGPPPYDFMASSMRPNMTFKAENGQLTIEADVATRVAAYGGNLFWPEFVITTADHPGAPFKAGAPQYQPEIRTNGTYVYETFPGYQTLGCRLQNDGGFTCAMLDDSFGGDSLARVFELSHFQCGNTPGSPYSTNYSCHNIFGGLPSNVPADVRTYTRDCASLDPDTNCRDRWRWEITKDRMTWYANGKKYMEHSNFDPGAQAMISKLIENPVYVYFGEFMYRLDKPARMHWDRIAINPKDASGKLLPPSTAETFCLGQPFNTCGATAPASSAPAPSVTNAPAPSVAVSPTPAASKLPSPKPSIAPSPVPSPTIAPSTAPGAAMTVTFNDKSGQDTALNGQYPSNVIDWGNGTWFLASPWQKLTTKSISFNGGGLKSATFKLNTPKTLTKLDLYNGGGGSTTVTLSCAGNTNKVVTVASKQLSSAVATGWTKPCSSVTISSTNGWDTNFDNLVIQ